MAFKTRWALIIALVVASCSIQICAYAQDSAAAARKLDKIIGKVNKEYAHQHQGDSTLTTIAALSKRDSLLAKALNDYYMFGLAHRKRAFEWNLDSSIIIFWVVIFLVMTGIVFSGLQFYKALYEAKGKTANPNLTLAAEMEASAKGIKISSSVLGLIILVISIAFFYLYLVYVYPISEIF
jgi:hypothetical protein